MLQEMFSFCSNCRPFGNRSRKVFWGHVCRKLWQYSFQWIAAFCKKMISFMQASRLWRCSQNIIYKQHITKFGVVLSLYSLIWWVRVCSQNNVCPYTCSCVVLDMRLNNTLALGGVSCRQFVYGDVVRTSYINNTSQNLVLCYHVSSTCSNYDAILSFACKNLQMLKVTFAHEKNTKTAQKKTPPKKVVRNRFTSRFLC